MFTTRIRVSIRTTTVVDVDTLLLTKGGAHGEEFITLEILEPLVAFLGLVFVGVTFGSKKAACLYLVNSPQNSQCN